MQESMAYGRERTAFGKPILKREVWQHKFVDLTIKLAAAKAFTYQIADRYNHEKYEEKIPLSMETVKQISMAKVLYGPGKAANAGGVATSGLEMSQNAGHMHWPREEVDARLHQIMRSIHAACVEHGSKGGHVNYVKGANVAGFIKVADAMIDQGVV
jgi:alkylation response protein AidB-like acyl-CoA dehydrogenase